MNERNKTPTSGRDIQEELSTLLEQKAAAEAEIEKKTLQLKKYKARYRQCRTDIVGLEEHLSALQADVEHETEALHSYESHIRIAEAELCALGPPTPAVSPFDIDAFVFASDAEPLNFPEVDSFKSILKSARLVELPEDILKNFGPLELLVLPPEGVMWLNDGIDRAVFVTPPYQYDPTGLGGGGSWEANPSLSDLMDGVGRDRELFVRTGDDYHYYGTYRCAGYSSLSTETSAELTTSVVRYARGLTATHKDHIAPVSIKFLDTLYSNGPLELQCFAFERTDFNHEFNDALLSSIKAIQSVNSPAATEGKKRVGVVRKLQPRSGTKRQRSSSSAGPGAKKKKQK